MRTLKEIRQFAESKGMFMDVRDRGTSYRAGGDILCYPADFDWKNEEVSIKHEKNVGFEGTGYDGRGRHYDLWILVPARDGEKKYVLAEYTSYLNVDAEKRFASATRKNIGRVATACSLSNPILITLAI